MYYGLITTIFSLPIWADQEHSEQPVSYKDNQSQTIHKLSDSWQDNGFAKIVSAHFPAGHASEVLFRESELRASGVGAIFVENPTINDLNLLKESNGFFYGPKWVTWHKKAQCHLCDLEERIDLTAKKRRKKKDDYLRKLKKTEHFQVEVGSLSPEAYAEWYPLYDKYVAGKAKGVRIIGENFPEVIGATDGLSDWAGIFVRDPDTSKIVAGVILELRPEDGVCKIKSAASDKSKKYVKIPLSVLTFKEATQYAIEHKFATLSYGSDPNFFGEFVAMGLQRFKTSLGFRPVFPEFGPFRLIKLLSTKGMESSLLTFTMSRPVSALQDIPTQDQVMTANIFGEPPVHYSVPIGYGLKYHPYPGRPD